MRAALVSVFLSSVALAGCGGATPSSTSINDAVATSRVHTVTHEAQPEDGNGMPGVGANPRPPCRGYCPPGPGPGGHKQ